MNVIMFSFFKKQLASVIEWRDNSTDILWYQFPASNNDQIINASKLIVAPGQGAVLVYEGKIADVIEDVGIYNLKTDNHPFITTMLKIRQSFKSEHKLYIYFFKKNNIVNQGWGTASPIKYLEPEYQFPIQLKMNGNYAFSIGNIQQFYQQIIGQRNQYTTQEAKELISNRIIQEITSLLAQMQYSYLQIDSKLSELSENVKMHLIDEFVKLGLTLSDFRIVASQFDSETEKRIAKIADISADAIAASKGNLSYIEMEKLQAMRDAAKNEGGIAGLGAQFVAGAELSKIYTQNVADTDNKQGSSDFEKIDNDDIYSKLTKLKQLLDIGVITQAEYDAKKKEYIDKL
ncbi:hypothetical protein A9G35_04380 [Gilliamella sp. Choc5-1]|nr:hypothetical protein A9G35_04380 [Gilliamella apicola]